MSAYAYWHYLPTKQLADILALVDRTRGELEIERDEEEREPWGAAYYAGFYGGAADETDETDCAYARGRSPAEALVALHEKLAELEGNFR